MFLAELEGFYHLFLFCLFFFFYKESYVWKMYQERSWEFFPVGDCFRKQYEDQLGWKSPRLKSPRMMLLLPITRFKPHYLCMNNFSIQLFKMKNRLAATVFNLPTLLEEAFIIFSKCQQKQRLSLYLLNASHILVSPALSAWQSGSVFHRSFMSACVCAAHVLWMKRFVFPITSSPPPLPVWLFW